MTYMSDQTNNQNEPKKISYKEAIKNKLEQKKKAANDHNANHAQNSGNLTMNNQIHKKPNNQRRRTGGS